MPFTAKILNESVAQSKEICYTIINKKIYFIKMPFTAKILNGGLYGNKQRCVS